MPDKLSLTRICDAKQTHFQDLLRLYLDAFPTEERRQGDDLISLLGRDNMYFMEIGEDGQVMGFILYWDFGYFRFVEHFAIYPEQRGRHVGSRVLRLLKESFTPIILEAEPLMDSLSKRRINFYQRNGFQLLDLAYRQPPYHKGMDPLPMLLISDKPQWVQAELNAAIRLVHHTVYGITG